MSDITEQLVEAVVDACKRHPSSAPSGSSDFNAPLWSALEQIGITLLSVPEARGGSGGDVLTTAAVLHVLGRHCASVPFTETALQAGWALAACNAPIPSGPMAAAIAEASVTLTDTSTGWILDGRVRRVPYGRHVDTLVLLVGDRLVLTRRDEFYLRHGANLADEARDDAVFESVKIPADRVFELPEDGVFDRQLFVARGAVGRMASMGGAAQRSLEMTLEYSSEREQFGRSIGSFQAVQHQIAEMAGEASLCKVVAESAAQAVDVGASFMLPVAAAKTASGYSAGVVARIAHQIHGAIGFTEEHDLRQCTTRIWSWRDEYGSTTKWAQTVGEVGADAVPDDLWPILTALAATS